MKNTILSICFLIFANIIFAQKDSTEIKATNKTDKLISAAVILESDTLFTINSLKGNYPVKFRAKEISSRINNIAKSYNSLTDSIYLNPTVGFTEIKYNEKLLMVVTEQDAKLEKTSVKKLSNKRLKNIVNGLNNEVILTPIGWLKSIGFFVLSLLVLYGLIKLINLMFEKINLRLSRIERKFLSRKGNLLRYFLPGNSNNIFVFLVNVLRIIVIVFILFICIPISFSFFHFSGNLVQKFYGYIEEPIKYVFMGIINFIPSLFFIIIIGITARYFVRVINVITTDIENGKLEVKNFHKDWAKPTGKLLGLLIYALALVLIFPYLPGSGSSAFQGVSIFIGAIISFGSTSAISNIIAGVVITYMRPFQIGDRVKIDNIIGDVIDKTILVTHLRTTKNEDVTIPNANILIGNIINYSSRDIGNIIVHTTVTLGYDVAWKKANELLLEAVNRAPHIFKDPAPFVLQTSLDDFYVSYELNAYTDEFKKLPFIYSEIHKNILDVFDEAGIEILSPGYTAARDGSVTTVPSKVNSEGKGPFSQLINHLTGRNQANTVQKNNTTEEN
jgi:small-conductance mechanosensitive channel